MALLIRKDPFLNIVLTSSLHLISLELLWQGFGYSFPEEIFNGVMILAIISAVIHQSQESKTIIK